MSQSATSVNNRYYLIGTSMLKCLMGTPVVLGAAYALVASAVFVYWHEWAVIEAARYVISAMPTSLVGNGLLLFALASVAGAILCCAEKSTSLDWLIWVFLLGTMWSTPLLFVKAPEIFCAVSAQAPYASAFALLMVLVVGIGLIIAFAMMMEDSSDPMAVAWIVSIVCSSAVAWIVDWHNPADVAESHGTPFFVTVFVGLVSQIIVLGCLAYSAWKEMKWLSRK